MSAIDRLLATALAEEGYLEKASNSQLDDKTANAGSANYTKYARDLDLTGLYNGKKQGYAWCDMFVDWCMYQTFGLDAMQAMTFQPSGGLGAGCTYSARYYKSAGRLYDAPEPGDQIFFTKDGGSTMYHTGIVVKVTSSKVYTIEGNTSSASGVVANGGAVAQKSYSLTYSRIGGYGRPLWSVAEEAEAATALAEAVTTTKEEDEDMTLETFKGLYKEMRAELQDNDASTYSQEAREWAVASGVVAGGSTTEFNGMWEDVLTREQAVVLMYRLAKMVGLV